MPREDILYNSKDFFSLPYKARAKKFLEEHEIEEPEGSDSNKDNDSLS